MDGVGESKDGTFVLGATIVPWELDAAICCRSETQIYTPLPNKDARLYMLGLYIRDNPKTLAKEDFERMRGGTNGMSGSDISILVKDLLM